MLCRNPYVNNGMAYGCGQCMPCRISKKRVWLHRIMLESNLQTDNSFVTLTYDDQHLPKSYEKDYAGKILDTARPTLAPKDLQDWLKRFRKLIEPQKIRYYAVGEYGDETQRPHYHIALFGFPHCERLLLPKRSGGCPCYPCTALRTSWGKGQIDSGTLGPESAGYIAGYVTKKMTSPDDFRLYGRHPEFARMSLRPGIGADFMDDVASGILAVNLEVSQADVPSALRHGSRLLPLGRYLTRRLRQRIGKEPDAPQSTLDQVKAELLPLRETAFNNSTSFKAEIVKAADGKVASIEARQRIFKKRKTL